MKTSTRLLTPLIAALIVFMLIACDDLEEKSEETPALSPDGGWDYPYYLVIGGTLSETLSLLSIKGENYFTLKNDVQLAGSGINQMTYHEGELYTVNSLSNSVVVYDGDDLSVQREISVGAGNNPMNMVFYEDRKAYISNFLTNTVSFYDLSKSEGNAIAIIDLPSDDELPRSGDEQTWARPGALAVAEGKVYCAMANLTGTMVAGGPGLIAVIDPESNELSKVIELTGMDTVGLLHDEPNGILYSISAGVYSTDSGFTGNGAVEIIDPSTDSVTKVIEVDGAPFEMVLAANGTAYLNNGKEAKILSFDTESFQFYEPIDIRDPEDSLGLSFASGLAPDGNGYLYAAEFNHDKLFVIDIENNNEIVGKWTVNDGPVTLGIIR